MLQNTAVLIGRFQPLHDGHKALINQVMTNFDKLIILVGSANSPRTIKNPWTFQERKSNIINYVETLHLHEGKKSVHVLPLNDYPYNDSQWIVDVNNTVSSVDNNPKTIVGFYKEGNDYLNWFKDFGFKDYYTGIDVNATSIRTKLLGEQSELIPDSVVDDHEYFSKEADLFSNYPFPHTLNFNCSDAIVECQGNILLIERKVSPGAGTWALPGGFKNNNETFLDCAIRELVEETNLKVPEKVLRGSIINQKLFDNPNRGMGIARNTLAVHIRIAPDNNGKLPKVKACDDAKAAKWISLHDVLNNYKLFDDHQAIVSTMTGVNPIPAYLNNIYF